MKNRLGIYIFNGAEVIDWAGPAGVFAVARRMDPELDAFLVGVGQDRSPRPESVHGLNARSPRRGWDFPAAVVVRVRSQRRQRRP